MGYAKKVVIFLLCTFFSLGIYDKIKKAQKNIYTLCALIFSIFGHRVET